ncbi:Protein of unknown function [Actinacidiphila alni]|uniref:DUF2637 domain-containing protein n=1 Tax=Actinacidiphila alni TaxID=380248 RepID=A0A1I2D398_9ACTN|nr:DUF2637 domain-containing protein [Actinacidiphila alni]SFE74533.1 Protein of unknown function [Actinacidiphila alni]
MAAIRLTRTHRVLIGVVVTGAVVIAAIGFAGSYAAVRSLALDKGFGWFANVFPIGVDAGIVVLLALDLLLTWLRIPFPLLRQTAWLLTAATIAFNGAAAWPDPLGVGMHAIIPVLFVVSVEAARHAIGRIADITADKHMESVRITRWILAPVPTFRLWRRMKLWELRSYEETIRREQDRLVYRARLRARYGVAWRRKAPVEAIMPLRLAKYGVPLAETADAGLEAAGIELTRPAKELTAGPRKAEGAEGTEGADANGAAAGAAGSAMNGTVNGSVNGGLNGRQNGAVNGAVNGALNGAVNGNAGGHPNGAVNGNGAGNRIPDLAEEAAAAIAAAEADRLRGGQVPQYAQYEQYEQYNQQPYPPADLPGAHDSPWFVAQQLQAQQDAQAEQAFFARQQLQQQMELQQQQFEQQQQRYEQQQAQQSQVQQSQVMVPAGPNRSRPLGGSGLNGNAVAQGQQRPAPEFAGEPGPEPEPEAEPVPEPPIEYVSDLQFPDGISQDEAFFGAYRRYVREHGIFPNARQFARYLSDMYNGTAPEERDLVTVLRDLRYRFQSESDTEHIP